MHKIPALRHARQSVVGADPQAVVIVFHDRIDHVALLPVADDIALQHRAAGLLVITLQQVQSVAEHPQPDVSPAVFVQGVDIVHCCSRMCSVAVGFKCDICHVAKTAVKRHETVGGGHPHAPVGIFGDTSHIGVHPIAWITGHAVELVPEHHRSVFLLLQQVQTAIEGAHPYAPTTVLTGVIHPVAAQRGLVATAVGIPGQAQPLRGKHVGRGLDQS